MSLYLGAYPTACRNEISDSGTPQLDIAWSNVAQAPEENGQHSHRDRNRSPFPRLQRSRMVPWMQHTVQGAWENTPHGVEAWSNHCRNRFLGSWLWWWISGILESAHISDSEDDSHAPDIWNCHTCRQWICNYCSWDTSWQWSDISWVTSWDTSWQWADISWDTSWALCLHGAGQ